MRKLYSSEIKRSMMTDDDPCQEKVIICEAMANLNKINIKKSKIKSLEAVAQRCSVKKVFLEISQNSQENTCARVPFLIKLQP